MRKLLLIAALVALIAIPVIAQPPGGGFMRGGPGGMNLLTNKSVQDELKLTDNQKAELKKATDTMRAAMTKAREDMDFEGMPKVFAEYNKSLDKIKEGLKASQSKRLAQIELQQAEKTNNIDIFKNKDVVKGLELTDKQKETIKETLADVAKDAKDVMEDAAGDRSKMRAAMQKVQGIRKEAYTKITGTLTADQKKAWKDMQGEKFEIKMEGFGPGGGKGKGKGKGKADF